ncbi:MAG TPA: hypothetical protein VIK74_04025 [Parasegetibacter sp.]
MNRIYALTFLFVTSILSSCAAVEGIFKAGMYWGIFLVVLVIGVILYLVMRLKK